MPQGIAIGKQSFFGKILPVPGLIITTILSAIILYGIDRPPFINNDFYNFVSTHRATVQASLSFLTSVFGFCTPLRNDISNQLLYENTLDTVGSDS